MIKKNVTEAKAELSKLLVLAEQGEEIIITRAGKPVVRLMVVENETQRPIPGTLKGKWILPKDFVDRSKAADKEIEEHFYS